MDHGVGIEVGGSRSSGGHPVAKDITDDFADKTVDTLNKGVISLCGTSPPGGSPIKKPKIAGEEQPTL